MTLYAVITAAALSLRALFLPQTARNAPSSPEKRPAGYSWRIRFSHAGQRLTLWGRTRRTLLRTLSRLAENGCTPSAYRVYQRNAAGQLYRTSLRRLLACA